MRQDTTEHVFARATPRAGAAPRAQRHARMPSTAGYMVGAGAAAGTLFFLLWWMLHENGDETPWGPAGLAASVVFFVAVAAREVVMRRAWTRYLLEQGGAEAAPKSARKSQGGSGRRPGGAVSHSATLRALQRQSEEADAGTLPEAHLDAYHSCKDYLSMTDGMLRSAGLETERRVAIRAGQERVRGLKKHHLLTWARGASRALTREAQLRARDSDKVESANRALEVLDAALQAYPEEPELKESAAAVHEYIASVKVGHWVELAERAAFRGRYRRAIERYRDALFYVSRESMRDETRAETAERIQRKIEMMRAHLRTNGNGDGHPKRKVRGAQKEPEGKPSHDWTEVS